MPPEALWKSIDVVEEPPLHLEKGCGCFYARDYVSKGGFKASEANQLISNFKKEVKWRGTGGWYYKEKAIKQFAWELSRLLDERHTVAAIPTSKTTTDPEYDDRFEQLFAELVRLKPGLTVERPFVRTVSVAPVHHGGERTIAAVRSTLAWVGFKKVPELGIWLIDDVITWGTHFVACRAMIQEHHPTCPVGGIFWGRTVWPSPFSPESSPF